MFGARDAPENQIETLRASPPMARHVRVEGLRRFNHAALWQRK